MKNFMTTLSILVLTFALSGCGIIPGFGNGNVINVVEPEEADVALYKQIAVPFQVYYNADETITAEIETSYNSSVAAWKENGSNWRTYEIIAPAYVDYLVNDPELSSESVSIRRDTVLSWQLFLTSTTGETPENVFDPLANTP